MDQIMSCRRLYKQHQQRTLQRIAFRESSDERTSSREFSRISAYDRFLADIEVELVNRELWQQFHGETTEMIITKSGRRMYPPLQLNISGLQSYLYYYVVVEVTLTSTHRHKYCGNAGPDDVNGNKSGWTTAGPAEPQPHPDRRIYLHPDGPALGAHWMQHIVSFSKMKITNNAAEPRNNLVLTSMHRYIPKVWIFQCEKASNLNELYSHPFSKFTFNETEFIAVTAYQNESITRLKINNNPFAKGFRETGQSRCKRKFQSVTAFHRLSQMDDEERVSSPEPDSNRSACNSDDYKPQTKMSKATSPEIASPDEGVGVTTSQRSLSSPEAANDRQDEMPSRLHRPWLSPSPTSAGHSNSLSPFSSSSSSPSPSSSSLSLSLSSMVRHPVIPSSYYSRLFHAPFFMQYGFPQPCCFSACITNRHNRMFSPFYH